MNGQKWNSYEFSQLPENPNRNMIVNDPLEQGKNVNVSIRLIIVQKATNKVQTTVN